MWSNAFKKSLLSITALEAKWCERSLTTTTTIVLWPLYRTRISFRWQTRSTSCMTANVLQTNNVDAQCDKLATELSWQRFASKLANFQLPHLPLTYPTCIWRLRWGDFVWVLPTFLVPENKSPWAVMRRCLHDPTFSRLIRTPTCHRRTDGRTNKHTTTTNTRGS